MPRTALLAGLAAALALAGAARADEAADKVGQGIAARALADWQVRVRWREKALVAFVHPATIQQSFDLFYDPQRAQEVVAKLCPGADDPVWAMLRPDQDVAIEPEVMGKGGFRVSCRATLGHAPAT